MKKYKKNLSILVMAVILLSSNLVSNAAPMKTNEKLQGRSLGEQVQLKKQVENMFPEEYHYILEYEQNGVSEMDVNDVKVIFDETKKDGKMEYNLIVFNNGQVFTNTSELLSERKKDGMMRASESTVYTKNFTVGDVGKYATFKATYVIELYSNDTLSSCDVVRSDFVLYPFNKKYKRMEDSNGNAYFGYVNCPTNVENSGVMYDIGVKVGNNRARGFARVSTGVDAAIWYMLNPYV